MEEKAVAGTDLVLVVVVVGGMLGGVMAVGVSEAVPVDAGAEVIVRVLTGVSAAKLGALVIVDVPPEVPTAVGALAVVVYLWKPKW